MVDEPTDNFAIMGDIHPTWGVVENTTLMPSVKYPLWARQRAYIEHCVTVRGKKMIGMFGRREKYDSDSSETELSDDESRYLKHIPFVKNYRQESQPVWKATADEDEPLFKPTCTASRVTVVRSSHVPGVNSGNSHNDDQDRIEDGVSAAINEVIEKTIRMTRELDSPATIDVLPTGLSLAPAYTIAPTPIRVQPNLASALEASTGEDGFSHRLSNKSTNGINTRWPNDHGERSFLITQLDESDSDTEGMDQNVERYGVGSDEGKVTSIDTRWYPAHGVSVIESLEYEPWSPID
ncbi:hypothetical protein L211DRAFT_595924 [Terfezia boudieri ATCC MYA-4762]|uniref:Uncharacterized protein n=1 Tax=Terfezia boudieri ATCC MYA-4762 TaxID=1051890 RepID=A0A3N4M0L9_9PEZI|nr:hypothetical protein L211DRAFT_595924 [Terfezia boudieri ATCC MYA-4762]